MNPDDIKRLVIDGLPGAEVSIMSDDNTHYEAVVISGSFEGKSRIARHQLIYGTLGSLVGNEIHAMSIRAHTPDEWAALNDSMS